MFSKRLLHLYFVVFLAVTVLAGCTSQQAVQPSAGSFKNVENVKAGAFDTGKMWTFDFPPVDYFRTTYSFDPTPEWFEQARLSALRLPGCTASFISEDGLVMTNHHCARGALDRINKEGEDIPNNGFSAATLEEERKIPGYYADQLVLIEDVTEEVQKAFASGGTDEEKVANRNRAITEIQNRYNEKTGYVCTVYTFFNGGKYSLYGFKRYNDVRLVFAPEEAVAFYGGDPDNFTYPRYDMDVTFYRVYGEDGKPLKTKNYFKWSAAGAGEGEPVFVIGNPGRTSRLHTVAQLEFARDYSYSASLKGLAKMEAVTIAYVEQHPEKRAKYQNQIFGLSNSRKVVSGRVDGLHDPVILAKKRDFERTLQDAVMSKPDLKAKYGTIWSDIALQQQQKAALFKTYSAYQFMGLGKSATLALAANIVRFANTSALPEAERPKEMQGEGMEKARARLGGTVIEQGMDEHILTFQLEGMQEAFAGKNADFNALIGSDTPSAAARRLLTGTMLTDTVKVKGLLEKPSAEILASADPFIAFVVKTEKSADQVRKQYSEIQAREQARVQLLGLVVFDVYGTSIPPDATFSLRIADGTVKGYSYNGTIAPVHTTFYGMYDRYYSFGKKSPWLLPERWLAPGPGFDLSTPLNFVSTNDIIGGNSGSPVVNRNLEIVGIAFDGNIESMPGDYIFDDTANRCVSVHSAGILEALEDIYGAQRLARELKAGSIQN